MFHRGKFSKIQNKSRLYIFPSKPLTLYLQDQCVVLELLLMGSWMEQLKCDLEVLCRLCMAMNNLTLNAPRFRSTGQNFGNWHGLGWWFSTQHWPEFWASASFRSGVYWGVSTAQIFGNWHGLGWDCSTVYNAVQNFRNVHGFGVGLVHSTVQDFRRFTMVVYYRVCTAQNVGDWHGLGCECSIQFSIGNSSTQYCPEF